MKKEPLIIFVLFLTAIFGADIVLEHADRMVTDLSGDRTHIKLSGHIKIKHENRVLKSDFADWEQMEGKVKFIGNVVLIDTNQCIYTDTLFYTRDKKFAIGTGNVLFVRNDSSLFVSGARGSYDGVIERLTMEGSPHLTSIDTIDSGRIDLDAQRLIYDMQIDRGKALGSAFITITEKDSTKPKTYIWSDSLVFYPKRDEIRAYGNVVIRQEDAEITCDSALYHRGAGRIQLDGNPQVSQFTNRLTGAQMVFELSKGELKKLWVYSSGQEILPHGYWRPPEDSLHRLPESEFISRTMLFEFEKNKIRLAHMIKEASAIYYPWVEDPNKIECNRTSGDSISVWFGREKLDSVEVFRNAEGEYITTKFNVDSMRTIAKSETLRYSGDYLSLSRSNQILTSVGNARLRYEKISLDAGSVSYNVETKILTAEPILSGDSLIGMPTLADEKQTMKGRKIIYNVDTGRGRMISASTDFDLGHYYGGVVQKAKGDTLYVANSRFTTCDEDTPHYHFWSNRLKLIPKEQAVSKYIVLFVSDVPVFAVPFFVFPIRTGRRSGILTLDIGQFQKRQRFVRNVGYYFAPSDYWDCLASFDYNEQTGWVLRGAFQYALRYRLRGNLSASYEIERKSEFLQKTGSDRWSLVGSHVQNISRNAMISGRANFVSDKDYLTDIEYNPQTRMQRTLASNLALSQNLDWGSFSADVERTENLQTGRVVTYLPKLRASRFSGPIFKAEDFEKKKIYNELSLSLSGYGVHYRADDTTGNERRTGVQSDFALSLPHSFGPYLTFSPSVNGHLVTIDEDRDSSSWPMRLTYGASATANTNLYGRVPAKGIFGLSRIMHDIYPSFGIAWSPEFENPDNFYSFGGIYPGYGSKRLNIDISISQDYSVETRADTAGNSRKIRLGSISNRISYDFHATTRHFSDLSTSIRVQPFSWFSMTAGFSHSLYPIIGDEVSGLRLLSRSITSEMTRRGAISFGDSSDRIARDWRISLSHYISESRSAGYSTINHWIKGNASVFITKSWRVDYSHYFDIEKGETISDELTIWRDMHCWEGIFSWTPTGYRKGWSFRINIKKLPDIKIEGSSGRIR